MTTNRIVNSIARMKAQLDARISATPSAAAKVEETRRALDMQWDEYVIFQDLKSLAVTSGRLSLDEGMTIYNYLGEAGPDKFNDQPVEVKVILTQVLQELLSAKIKAA